MDWCMDLDGKGLHHLNKGPWRRLLYDKFGDLDADDQMSGWDHLVGYHGQVESWTSGWKHGAWQSYVGTLCRSTCRGVTYGHPMRSAKAGMLCRRICWCDMDTYYVWANGEVVHSCATKPWFEHVAYGMEFPWTWAWIDRFLMSPRCSRSQEKTCDGIRMCILMVWAYGWTDHPTSSSHERYQCAEICWH